MGRFIDIQNDAIKRFRIDICDGTKCRNDWGRTHAHPKKRRVCKWVQKNSIQSTFELLHEIGHIEGNASWMRRCEEEWYATHWALECAYHDYNLEIPNKILKDYQEYIDMEKDRGKRRGGKHYYLPCEGDLELAWSIIQG